jgi:hypothetical protein
MTAVLLCVVGMQRISITEEKKKTKKDGCGMATSPCVGYVDGLSLSMATGPVS